MKTLLDTERLVVGVQLAVLLLALILVGGMFLQTPASWTPGMDIGGDLKQHAAAARLLQEAREDSLYDPSRFGLEITRMFQPQALAAGHYLQNFGYLYSPLVAVVAQAALSLISYPLCVIGWFLFSLFCTGVSVYVLAQGCEVPRRVFILGALSFPPLWYGLSLGQNHVLSLLIIASALHLAARQRELVAGLVLSCLFYKPQLIGWLGLSLLLCGHWRMLAAALGGSCVWLLGEVLCLGSAPFIAWVHILLGAMGGRQLDEAVTNSTFKGWLQTLGGSGTGVTIGSLCLMTAALVFLARTHRPPTRDAASTLAAAAALWTVFSPYVKPYDLVMALPFLTTAGRPLQLLWAGGLVAVCSRLLGGSWAVLLVTPALLLRMFAGTGNGTLPPSGCSSPPRSG